MYQRSFIKWVGGKYRSLSQILGKFPVKFDTYYEPFLGSGVTFFNVETDKAILNDCEYKLVSTFRSIKRESERVCAALAEMSNDEESYYSVRYDFNNSSDVPPGKKAAQFIYLNKCGFNGLYRVNRAGSVNVAFGKRSGAPHQDYETIRVCSKLLQNTTIMNADYQDILSLTRCGDFVYMDPPYYKEFDRTFTGYNVKQFSDEDHERLALECKFLSSRGVLFALSNSDTPFIRNLYKDYYIFPVYTNRTVSRDTSTRGIVGEILITNYCVGRNADC